MTPQDQKQQQIQSVGGDTVRDQDKIQLVLAYFGCLCFIPLLTVKDSEYVKWHARQGTALFIAELVLGVGISVILSFVGVGFCLGPLLNLAFLVLSVIGIVKALKPERWRMPVLADLAEKINL